MRRSLGLLAAATAATLAVAPTAAAEPTSERLASLAIPGAETVSYDPATQMAYVSDAGSVAMHQIDVSDPSNPQLSNTFDLSSYGSSVQTVAVTGGLVAIAVAATVPQDDGSVVFFDAADGAYIDDVTVGALPDDIKFSPDGALLVTANEGEPNADYSVDPLGSISIIPIDAGVPGAANTIDFSKFEPQRAALEAQGLRLFGPGATLASDVEPEYITISPDSSRAYVTLQENNGIAVVDLAAESIISIRALGLKDHSVGGNELDASDRDTVSGNLLNWPVYGMYLPDQMTMVGGYLITANEGDARDYDNFGEESRVKDLDLDPTAFPTAASLQTEANLGRYNVSTVGADPDDDGDVDVLYGFGARSISVWTTSGALMWDSGSDLERLVSSAAPASWDDGRSDNKGPEPEGIASGVVDGRTYVYVALERTNGVAVWDVTNPLTPQAMGLLQPADSDVSPEGMAFVAATDSPNERPLLLVANEVSGTFAVWAVGTAPIENPTLPETGSSMLLLALAAAAVLTGGVLVRSRSW